MKTKNIICILFIACLLALAGCGQTDPPSGESVPVAKFTEIPLPAYEGEERSRDFFYGENEIICLDHIWVPVNETEQHGHLESRLWAFSTENEGDWRTIRTGSTATCQIDMFTVDPEGNLYLYEYEPAPDASEFHYNYYLRKLDAEGHDVYRTGMPPEIYPMHMYTAHTGETVLLLSRQALFYDSMGRYQGEVQLPWIHGRSGQRHNTNSVVYAEGQGYFLWDLDDINSSVSLWEINFRKGTISDQAITISMSDVTGSQSALSCTILSGKESCLLISTKDVLWQYNLSSCTAEEVLRWDNENIEIDGRNVAQINYGTADQQWEPLLNILFYEGRSSYNYYTPMAATVTYMDSAALPERKTVTIGLGNSFGNIDMLIRRFNRQNSEYRAVSVKYRPEDLKELFMYGKDVPDLLDVTGIRTQWLDSKELLEDLTPYFQQSTEVSKDDILPAVWVLSEQDGKLTSMAASFTIDSLFTAADVPENGWDYEQYLSLSDKYPNSWYLPKFTASQVLWIITATAQDLFIDWDANRCSFDCSEFIELLEKTISLNYPPHRKIYPGTDAQIKEDLAAGKILFQSVTYGSPFDYNRARTLYGDTLKNVGYPTADGKPLFLFQPSQCLAIYSLSPCKDGAWAFLEFLLSGDRQSWYSGENDVFPVRIDAFDVYLSQKRIAPQALSGDVESFEDTPEKLRYMTEHMGKSQNAQDEITTILGEEVQAYFAGDKDAAETARIIQNRVQLYLDENMK